MDALLAAGEWVGLVLGGLIVRFAAAVAFLAVMVAVLMPVILAFEGGRRLVRRARGILDLHGFEWRRGLRYTPAHLWLAERGDAVRVGLDSMAARLLAGAGTVDVVPVGTRVTAGAPIARFRTGAFSIAVPAPVAGVVAAVNPQLGDQPSLAARQPYAAGWLAEIGPSDRQYRALPRATAARRWFEGEAVRFNHSLEHAMGVAAADGGVPIVADHLLLTPEQVGGLAKDFLQATVLPAD